jgi:hypothetical protein
MPYNRKYPLTIALSTESVEAKAHIDSSSRVASKDASHYRSKE